MKITLTLNNEHHVQEVSAIVDTMSDSAFNNVTMVCSDGQLKVNGLTLALLLPAPYRNLDLGEGALLLLPQHKVQEIWALMVTDGNANVQGEKQERLQDQEKVELKEDNFWTKPHLTEFKLNQEIENINGIELHDNQTEDRNQSFEHFDDIEDSLDEDSNKDKEKKDRRGSIVYEQQGLQNVIFPRHAAGPLCAIETKAKAVNWLLRRAIQAVWPHGLNEGGVYNYGVGDNVYWRQEVDTALLQSNRAKEIVGHRQTFSLATFINWEDLKNLGNTFNKGPSKEAFKRPVKFWSHFKIVIIEHHAIICGINVNSQFLTPQ